MSCSSAIPESRAQPARAVAADAPNANYAVSAREEFTPTAIWMTAPSLYFRFARNAPVPAIFRYANGGERAVNSTAPRGRCHPLSRA